MGSYRVKCPTVYVVSFSLRTGDFSSRNTMWSIQLDLTFPTIPLYLPMSDQKKRHTLSRFSDLFNFTTRQKPSNRLMNWNVSGNYLRALFIGESSLYSNENYNWLEFSKSIENNRQQKNLIHQWVLLATIIDRFLLVIFLIYASITGSLFLYEALFSNGLPSTPFPSENDPGFDYSTQLSCEFDARVWTFNEYCFVIKVFLSFFYRTWTVWIWVSVGIGWHRWLAQFFFLFFHLINVTILQRNVETSNQCHGETWKISIRWSSSLVPYYNNNTRMWPTSHHILKRS